MNKFTVNSDFVDPVDLTYFQVDPVTRVAGVGIFFQKLGSSYQVIKSGSKTPGSSYQVIKSRKNCLVQVIKSSKKRSVQVIIFLQK